MAYRTLRGMAFIGREENKMAGNGGGKEMAGKMWREIVGGKEKAGKCVQRLISHAVTDKSNRSRNNATKP